MNSKPLTYESRKSVILYMDARLRFNIAQRLPSLRSLEKIVPLVIDSLEFTKNQQFSMNNTNGRNDDVVIERPGNISLHKVDMHILWLFLGGRRTTTLVRHLHVGRDFVIRLPESLKIKVDCLEIPREAEDICKALEGVLHESSFPLKRFKTKAVLDDELDHPWIMNARQLEIEYNPAYWYDEFIALSNQEVRVISNCFEPERMSDLVQHWIDTLKPIGTRFTFEHYSKHNALAIMWVLKQKCKKGGANENRMGIPMNSLSEIGVTFSEHQYGSNIKWIIVMEVRKTR